MSIYQTYKPGGGGDYLKLKDGDKVKLRIVSEPAISVYREGDKPRYSWVVWNRNEKKAQVYTGSISVYRQIAELTDEWGDPTSFDVTIKRTGSGMQDTEYSVVPVKTSAELTDEETEAVEKIDLIKASKGKWLSEYAEDAVLPAPVSNEPPREDSPPPSDEDAAQSGYDSFKAKGSQLKGEDTVIEDIGDEPINLDDIPFS